MRDIDNSNLKIVEREAFGFCSQLREVVLPASVERICDSAFMSSAISSVKFVGNSGNGLCIETNAFSNDKALQSVELPSTLRYIEHCAFEDAVSLETVKIDSTDYEISDFAFVDCVKLKNINLEHAKVLGKGAFENCIALKDVNLKSCTKMYKDVFCGDNLEHIVFCENFCHVSGSTFGSMKFIDSNGNKIKVGDPYLSQLKGKEFRIGSDNCLHQVA